MVSFLCLFDGGEGFLRKYGESLPGVFEMRSVKPRRGADESRGWWRLTITHVGISTPNPRIIIPPGFVNSARFLQIFVRMFYQLVCQNIRQTFHQMFGQQTNLFVCQIVGQHVCCICRLTCPPGVLMFGLECNRLHD
jgi:hypothetical protein